MTSPLILVADRHSDNRQQLCVSLEENGFRAIGAGSAPDIWHVLDNMPVNALVLDGDMRGADGMDLCRDVRERSQVPVILVSANCTEVDRVVGLELGADDYMAKPCSTRELAARLRAVMRRGKMERVSGLRCQSEARFGQWAVSFARREVLGPEGRSIHLTAAEFSLLAILIDNAQTVIARNQVMELAGVRDAPSSDRSIDVLVSRLRRKLGRSGYPAPIVTVRGAGYMLSAPIDRR